MFIYLRERERERQRDRVQCKQGGAETDTHTHRIQSRPQVCAVSTEPDAGLELLKDKIMT